MNTKNSINPLTKMLNEGIEGNIVFRSKYLNKKINLTYNPLKEIFLLKGDIRMNMDNIDSELIREIYEETDYLNNISFYSRDNKNLLGYRGWNP